MSKFSLKIENLRIKNKYIEITLYVLFIFSCLLPILLINNLIFTSGENLNISDKDLSEHIFTTSEFCYKGSDINLEKIDDIKEFNTSFRDVYIFPEIENIKCIGKVVDLYFENNAAEVIIGFNKKVFLYYFNGLILFSVLIFYLLKINFKKSHYLLFYLFIVYSIYYSTTFLKSQSIGSHPLEFQNEFFFLYLIFFTKKFDNSYIKTGVFIFFLFFHPSLFGILILVIFISENFTLKNNFMNNKLFFSLPVVFSMLRFLSGLDWQFGKVWTSLIQDPLTGLSIYPDLQISLTALKCNVSNFSGHSFLYTGYNLGCPVPFYNPLFQFFNIDINLNFLILFISFLFFMIYCGIYKFFLNYFKNNKEVVVFFMLSPCLNFLFNYGNLDIFTLAIGLLALYKFQDRWFLGTVLIFVIAINEIHPLGLILGIIVTSFFKKNFKIFFVNILSLLLFFLVLNQDSSEFSVKNELLNFSQTTDSLDYVGNLGVAYGITLDLQKLLNIFNLEYSLSIGFIALVSLSVLVLIFGHRLFKNKVNYGYIENSLLIWFREDDYRLAITVEVWNKTNPQYQLRNI